jgi:hypothetical protein
MITERSSDENNFAERCKLALEKSWGTPIPKPKALLKIKSEK